MAGCRFLAGVNAVTERYWQSGDVVAMRWLVNGRIWIAHPNIVVKDSADETQLLLLPGAQGFVPRMLWQGATNSKDSWDRWTEEAQPVFDLRAHPWNTHRLLTVLRPGTWYSIMHFWHATDSAFKQYYVNFQLPFKRSRTGFDSYDLELDLVVEPTLEWRWKDIDEYERGIVLGHLRPEWVAAIDSAKHDVLALIEQRRYPFDGAHVGFRPDPAWRPPVLPAGWDTSDASLSA